MDREKKLAAAKKKLKKFQARSSQKQTMKAASLQGSSAKTDHIFSVTPLSSLSATPTSNSPTPPQERKPKLTSTEGLREISQEISSLLSENTFGSKSHDSIFGSHDAIMNGGDLQDTLSSSQTTTLAPLTTTPLTSSVGLTTAPQTTFPTVSLAPVYTSLAGLQTTFPVHSFATSLGDQTSFSDYSTIPVPIPNSTLSFSRSAFPVNTKTSSAFQAPRLTVFSGSSSLDGFEMSELQQKVKVHAQTIDILVQEKSTLQSELKSLRETLSSKNKESSEVKGYQQAVQQQLAEAEREKHFLSGELSRRQKALSQSQSECVDRRRDVEKLRTALEDQQQENTELISKITSQSAEFHSLQSANSELQSRLNMAELLAQQLSGGVSPSVKAPPTDHTHSQRLEEAESEVTKLRSAVQRVSKQRDQALSDLAALRDTLLTQEHSHASKMSEVQGRLSDSLVENTYLQQEVEGLKQEKESLSLRLSSEQAQMADSKQVAIETLRQERDGLYDQVQQHLNDNQQLVRMNSEQEARTLELEMELSRLSEQAVDHQSLLTTISQDKETLSRAIAQNKELKNHLAELQDAFIRLSHQNMELASDLETERHNAARMKKVLDETISDVLPPIPVKFSVGGNDDVRIVDGAAPSSSVSGVLPADISEAGDDVKGSEDYEMQVEDDKEEVTVITPLSERTSLLEQLQLTQTQYCSLVAEHKEVLKQLEEALHRREGNEDTDLPGEGDGGEAINLAQMSSEQLVIMQGNFNALQQKFILLMTEKAELLDRLQEHEHTILKLSGETETIGEYITLYQTQREALKQKFHEKDTFIQQIVAEKLAMQTRLQELQALVRQVLADRPIPSSHAPPLSPPHKSHTPPHHPHHRHSDLPLHLQPVEPHSFIQTNVKNSFEELDSTLEDKDGVSDATTEQIMNLLDQFEAHGSSVSTKDFVPCSCCTGELIVV